MAFENILKRKIKSILIIGKMGNAQELILLSSTSSFFQLFTDFPTTSDLEVKRSIASGAAILNIQNQKKKIAR